MKRSFLIYFLVIFLFPVIVSGQEKEIKSGEYLYEIYLDEGEQLLYRIMYPYDFDSNKSYPLVLFLHGMGERGNDNEKQLIHGSKLFKDSLESFPAIVLFPQCPETDYWANISRPKNGGEARKYTFYSGMEANPTLGMVIDLVEELLEKPYVDENRFYVSGLSMGGMGTFDLSWRMKDKIAAAMPICGGGPVDKVSEMTAIPFWVFHGLKDNVVNPNFSIDMVKRIQKAGGKAKITLFENATHNSWAPAFADPDFLKWMFSQRRVKKEVSSYNTIHLSPKVQRIYENMTLDEKIGQLNLVTPGGTVTGEVVSQGVEQKIKNGQVGGIFGIRGAGKVKKAQKIAVNESRLGIPLLVGLDVIHGHQTIFPIPLALSCTWDMNLIEKCARQAAREATAEGLMWTFSPMVDIARDPRWGRIAEGAGEDPYLGSRIAEAMVRGYQGYDLKDPTTMLSCVKHFANYGAAEGGRDYSTVDMSQIRSHNEYLPPYKAAVDAGVSSVMTSFNVMDYVPASANKDLFTSVLRKKWGFDGFVVTDYTAVEEMTPHGIGDLQKVSARALNAGIDMDMVSEGLLTTLKQSIMEGKVSEESVNIACRRILKAKEKLGLFDDPYLYFDESRAAKEIFTDSNRAFAREVAGKSIVLLKNNNELLPLQKGASIALIGPLADSRRNMLGTWSVSGDHSKAVTLIEGIKNAVGSTEKILYAKGANISDDPEFARKVNAFGPEIVIDERHPDIMIEEALEVAAKSDVIVAVVGEAADMSGEGSSLSKISLQPSQKKLLKALKGTGKPIVMILFNGRPLVLGWEKENMDAILDVWFGGTEGGNAIADVLFGEVNPGAKLTTSFPVNEGQIPVYHSMLNTGRPDSEIETRWRSRYLDIPNEPVFPFGFGLSYTKFEYGKLELDNNFLANYSTIYASITVTNKGKREGHEIVQLYIRDLEASISRPVMELKGFRKIFLKPGESKKVTFEIDKSILSFYNSELELLAEPGDFEVMVGPDSGNTQKVRFTFR